MEREKSSVTDMHGFLQRFAFPHWTGTNTWGLGGSCGTEIKQALSPQVEANSPGNLRN